MSELTLIFVRGGMLHVVTAPASQIFNHISTRFESLDGLGCVAPIKIRLDSGYLFLDCDQKIYANCQEGFSMHHFPPYLKKKIALEWVGIEQV